MKRILVVDDEPRIIEAFENAFNHDYEVLSAKDGEDGIRLIKKTKLDLIVLDWRLKGEVEGKTVLAFAKRSYPRIPVFVVTASIHAVEEIKAFGADQCFLKPCADLLEKIKEVLPPDFSSL